MYSAPLVSVILLYYKRRETIEEAVRSVIGQDYPCREILLIDNHSEDDLRQWVESQAFDLKLIELSENRGACGGRNAGIGAAKGDILVFLDDDMSFQSAQELSRIVEAFDRHRDMHVLAFQVCDPDTGQLRLREWCHPQYWRDFADVEFDTSWFCEGASAFRREVFEVCGPYYEPLFYGAEGHDVVVRVLDHGYRILHTPQIRVGHRAADEGRTPHRQYYYFTRNYIWMAFKDYTLLDAIRFVAARMAMMSYFTLRTGTYRSFLLGVWDGLRGLRNVWRDRTPISKTTLKYIAELDKARPSLRVRLAKHKAVPQL